MAVESEAEEKEKGNKDNQALSDNKEKQSGNSNGNNETLSRVPPPLQQQNSISPSMHKVQFANGSNNDGSSSTASPVHFLAYESANNSQSSSTNNSPSHRPAPGRRHKRTVSEASYFSASSLSRTSSTSSSSNYSYTAPDGGWGWVIVIASFLINMIADGVTFSFGVLFVELQNEFHESKAVTAGVVSVFHAVPLLSGPIASALTDRYGCRKMTILGSLLATTGFLLSSICYRLELLYVTFGLISGFGLSLCYVAAIVIVAYYFDRRRSFATGISVCGSGVGTFIFAPFTQYLVEHFGGWRGATVILAGCFLNMCVCGALFRDLEWNKKLKQGKQQQQKLSVSRQNSQRDSFGSVSSPSQCEMPEIEEIKELLENGDIRNLFSKEDLEDCPRLSSSLVNIPTFIQNRERLPEEVVHALAKNKRAYKLVMENYPEALQEVVARQMAEEKEKETAAIKGTLSPPEEKTGVKLKRKVSSLFRKKPLMQANAAVNGENGLAPPSDISNNEESSALLKPNRSILKKPQTLIVDSDHHRHSTAICIEDDNGPNGSTGLRRNNSRIAARGAQNFNRNLHHLRIRRQSLTYRGAMLNISRYRLRASSCPDIFRNSMATLDAAEDLDAAATTGCCSFFRGQGEDSFNFFNSRFIVFCLSNFILYAWYDVMYVYLVDYAERDLGMVETATYLISVIGLLNTMGEVMIGWMGDQVWMNMNVLYAVCMVICGVSTALVPLFTNYSLLAAMAGLYGFAISANYSLTSPILVELVSLEQFSSAYGILLLVQGISNLVGPPFAGYLYDVTGEWLLTFGLAGLFISISGVLLLLLPCLKQIRRKRKRNYSMNSEFSSGAAVAADSIVVVRERKTMPKAAEV